MTKWVLGLVLLLSALSVSDVSHAGYAEGNQFSAGNTNAAPAADAYGQIVRAFLNELLGGEDAVNNVFKVESRWTNIPTGTTTAMFAADIAIKNAPGLVHAITCYSDATATAGTIADADFRTICRHAYRLQQSNLADVVTISEYDNGLTNPRRMRAA